jgi:hypothetical protein
MICIRKSGNQEKNFRINHEEHEGTSLLSAEAPQFFYQKTGKQGISDACNDQFRTRQGKQAVPAANPIMFHPVENSREPGW